MYNRLTFFILFFTLLSGFVGCQKKEQIQKPPSDVLARVNGEVLTEGDLELFIPEAYRDFITPDQKRDYVRGWIENEILYQEAKRKKIDRDQTIKWRIEQAIRNTLIESFLDKELGERVKVSEDEAKEYYEKNKSEFIREQDEVRISHILVRNIAEAGLVSIRLQEGESFDMIAKAMSLDEATKETGGDLGYVTLSNLPPDFYEAVTRLKPGGIAAPIRTDYGFDIIMLTDKKQKGSIKRYELVKNQITNSLTFTKRKKEVVNLLRELKKDAKVQTFGWATGIFGE
jgi:peptidyl-prolyl cis-trans isomerase C